LLIVEVLRKLQHSAHFAPVHAHEMIRSSWGTPTNSVGRPRRSMAVD
jgi:hypothetical protein